MLIKHWSKAVNECSFNSLAYCGALWRQRTRSPLVKVLNLNHCWFVITQALWHVHKQCSRYDNAWIIHNWFSLPYLTRYNDVIMSTMASQVTSLTIVYSTVYSATDERKYQSSVSLVRGIHWWPVNSPHKGPVTRKTFPFDDVIMPGPIS